MTCAVQAVCRARREKIGAIPHRAGVKGRCRTQGAEAVIEEWVNDYGGVKRCGSESGGGSVGTHRRFAQDSTGVLAMWCFFSSRPR